MSRISDAPQLAVHEVHLWKIPLAPSESLSEASLAVLSQHERERAAGFVSQALRAKWCQGRVALRAILARYLACEPDAILFRKGEHGKLSLPGAPLQFNFSHSAELALLAIARDAELGVDLEFPTPERPFLKLSERFFAASEAEAIRQLPPEQLCAAFYRCWTRKEALLKGLGAGITLPLQSFTVSIDAGPRVALSATSNFSIRNGMDWVQDWILYSLELPAPYCGALALRDLCPQTMLSPPPANPSAAWQMRYFDFCG